MNITPSTFNPGNAPYSLVNGIGDIKKVNAPFPLTVLLLNRPGEKPYQAVLWQELVDLPVKEVIIAGYGNFIADYGEICNKTSSLKIIRMEECVSSGEIINTGIREAACDRVLVFWSDMKLSLPSLSESVIGKALDPDLVCQVPALNDVDGDAVPNCLLPAFDEKSKLKVYPVRSRNQSSLSLFPFDFCGLYNRRLFMEIGGYDYEIKNSWWQKMDFGFRTFLWGKRIESASPLTINYLGNPPSENNTPDESYKYFFLKNLAVHQSGGKAILPLSAFLPFWISSGEEIWKAWKFFLKIKEWVAENSRCFIQEALDMTKLWEWEE